ncbi:corticotropin-releasing factor receptor 2-like, partial [Anneissia japonica]|uniref:corticotropin-releasing factor receptor 2-like n=1 Tax=Anneissia japonica TaxID=1529436 RepID=UPI0014258618
TSLNKSLKTYYLLFSLQVAGNFVFASEVFPSSISPFENDNYTNLVLTSGPYSFDELQATILKVLKGKNLSPENQDAQQTICDIWNIYESSGFVNLEPNVAEGRYCESFYDNIMCWPPSPPGEVHQRCPKIWNGVEYEDTNVIQYCHENGTWNEKSDYDNCKDVKKDDVYMDIATVILYAGYSLSFVSLIIAFGIFLAFKSLRCLRNYIHWNFITSFIFLYIMFFCNHQMVKKSMENLPVCRLLLTLIIYAQCTNFFWMFVEGLYLYTLVVMALKPEKMTLVKYCLIGWGTPFIITMIYAICELQFGSGCWASVGAEILTPDGEKEPNSVEYLEFIFVAPVMLILVTNTFFLFHIGFILMTKLKASHSFETRQYRKALRGILLLLPLLGVTGIIFVVNSGHSNPALIIANALLHSFEGFFVVLIYVFCNQEVQRVIKRKIHHWREEQSLPTRQVSRRGSHSRQNSIVSAMFAKQNGDTVDFDKTRHNSKVGCCNFTKSQKAEGYNMITTHSFDVSTRQCSLDGLTSEKCFSKPGFESISEVSTGQENSCGKSDTTSVVYHEKQPDSNQNVTVPSGNGSINQLTATHNESDTAPDSELNPTNLNCTQLREENNDDISLTLEECSEVPEPEEHNALLEKEHESELRPNDDDDCEVDSALMAKQDEDTVLTDDINVDVKSKNSMIIPKGLTIGTQL